MFIFPRAGPDIKYLLGFIRTQLSTTTTIVLVFGPKVSFLTLQSNEVYEVVITQITEYIYVCERPIFISVSTNVLNISLS